MSWNAWLFIWMFSLTAQIAGQDSLPGIDCLTPAERTRLTAEIKLDQRVRIYAQASERCKNLLASLFQRQEAQAVAEQLKCWSATLHAALQDIRRTPGRKDKSSAIKNFEIRLRRALGAVQAIKIKAGVDQQEEFDLWLAQAEEVRKELVGILFPK